MTIQARNMAVSDPDSYLLRVLYATLASGVPNGKLSQHNRLINRFYKLYVADIPQLCQLTPGMPVGHMVRYLHVDESGQQAYRKLLEFTPQYRLAEW